MRLPININVLKDSLLIFQYVLWGRAHFLEGGHIFPY